MKKRVILYFIPIISMIGLSGCCGKQVQAFSDGNYYYPNWCKYDSCNSNGTKADCYKDGEFVETLYPLHPNQVADIRYRKKQNQEALDSLNRSLEKANENLRKQNEAMTPKTYNVYHYGY